MREKRERSVERKGEQSLERKEDCRKKWREKSLERKGTSVSKRRVKRKRRGA